MVNLGFTHIAVVLDRSGSMECLKTDMEGGFNAFIAEQRKVPGRCTLSLYQFDNEYEIVYQNRPLTDVPALVLTPRNTTALLDAIGRTVNDVGTELAAMQEEDRPDKVFLVIITDGMENASKDFTREKIKEMIQHQEQKYSWQIVFLGANFDAYKEGMSLGFDGAKCMTYANNSIGTRCVYSAMSSKLTNFRNGVTKDVTFDDVDRQVQRDAGADSQ